MLVQLLDLILNVFNLCCACIGVSVAARNFGFGWWDRAHLGKEVLHVVWVPATATSIDGLHVVCLSSPVVRFLLLLLLLRRILLLTVAVLLLTVALPHWRRYSAVVLLLVRSRVGLLLRLSIIASAVDGVHGRQKTRSWAPPTTTTTGKRRVVSHALVTSTIVVTLSATLLLRL